VRIRYAGPPPVADLTLAWDLFNAAVLAADLTIDDGRNSTSARVTPYAPTVQWQR
jgi:hypothetical protein